MSAFGATPGAPVVTRSSFDIGTVSPTAQIPNQTSQPWLTVWNTGSAPLTVGSAEQVVGALRSRSFFVVDDDPIIVTLARQQRNTVLVVQPGVIVRHIAYALGPVPLADVADSELYSSPALLISGSTLGGLSTTITPNGGECYTHADVAFVNAQADGVGNEIVDASYGQGINEHVYQPPLGASRQVVRLDGPTSVVINVGSVSAACYWNLFGASRVVR